MQQPESKKEISIAFIDLHVLSLQMNGGNEPRNKNATEELSFQLNIEDVFNDSDKKYFGKRFKIELKNEQNGFSLFVDIVGDFKTDDDITDAFKQSHFVKINAPAIAYPYIRSFISFIALNSGYNPITLPTFNFTKIAEKKKAE